MPYKSNGELPSSIRNSLPAHAQSIYRNAFNSAFAKYGTDSRAATIAWGAVKNAGYVKGKSGKWKATRKRKNLSKEIEDTYIRLEIAKLQELAKWKVKSKNDLPDSAFAVIKKGGKKDKQGKTVPRGLRMLPHHTSSVKNPTDHSSVDLPHLRNALARVEQPATQLSPAERKRARSHLLAHARALKVGEAKKAAKKNQLSKDPNFSAIRPELIENVFKEEVVQQLLNTIKDNKLNNKKSFSINSDFRVLQELSSDENNDLIIEGTAIIEGTYKDYYYPPETLKGIADQLAGKTLRWVHSGHPRDIIGKVEESLFKESPNRVVYKARVMDDYAKRLVREELVDGASVSVFVEEDSDEEHKLIAVDPTVRHLGLLEEPACEGTKGTIKVLN